MPWSEDDWDRIALIVRERLEEHSHTGHPFRELGVLTTTREYRPDCMLRVDNLLHQSFMIDGTECIDSIVISLYVLLYPCGSTRERIARMP